MHDAVKDNTEKRAKRVIAALKANNMEGWYLPDAASVRDFVEKLIPEGAVVSSGGSMTLAETGVIDLLGSGRYQYLDRSKATTGEEIGRLYRQAFSADWYLASANAITEAGEIYNVDGNSNRVAAITFGPANVLLVAGCNKIVKDLAAAKERVEAIAAPANTVRLSCATPCTVTGKCEHCHSPARICCTTTIHSFQRIPGRIKVLLVGEPLGF